MTTKRFFLLILVLAFLVRLGAVLAMRDINKFHGNQCGADCVEFDQLAKSLASGNGFQLRGQPTAFRAPGFPVYMAGVYAIFGEHYAPQYIGLCLLGALTCALTYLAGRELGSESFARIAGLLGIFYLPVIYSATIFESENLFPLLLITGLLALLHGLRGRNSLLLLSGLLFGWAILTRPFLVLSMPFVFLVLVWNAWAKRKQPLMSALVPGILLAAGCLAVVAPWTYRNYRLTGKLVFVATNGGSTFYGSYNDVVLQPFLLGNWVSTTELPGRAEIDAQPDEVTHDAKEWELGIAWAKTHVSQLPKMEVFKVLRAWGPDVSSQNTKYTMMQVVTYTPFLLLYIAAAWRRLRQQGDVSMGWRVCDALMVSVFLIALIFFGNPRYRDGNAPVLMLYAATALPMIPPRWLGVQS